MDFDSLAKLIAGQFVTVWNAPVPFIAALLLGLWVIWKLVQREFATRLANADSTTQMLRERLDRNETADTITMAATSQRIEAQESGVSATGQRAREGGPRQFAPADITADFLSGMFEGRTSVQAKAMLVQYVGKWMVVEGLVKAVNDNGISGYLVGVRTTGGTFAVCSFDKQDPKVAALSFDGAVRLAGRIEDMDGMGITLRECELLS